LNAVSSSGHAVRHRCVSLAHGRRFAAGKEKAELAPAATATTASSQTENIPSLAGQLDQFSSGNWCIFRSGARKNEQMQPIVEHLTTRISATSAPILRR